MCQDVFCSMFVVHVHIPVTMEIWFIVNTSVYVILFEHTKRNTVPTGFKVPAPAEVCVCSITKKRKRVQISRTEVLELMMSSAPPRIYDGFRGQGGREGRAHWGEKEPAGEDKMRWRKKKQRGGWRVGGRERRNGEIRDERIRVPQDSRWGWKGNGVCECAEEVEDKCVMEG